MTKETTKIRQRILKERGVAPIRSSTTKHRRLAILPETPTDHLKTHAMRLQELKFGIPIEELLLDGSLSQISNKLGLDKSTISRWIKRLDLTKIKHFVDGKDTNLSITPRR